MLAPVYPTDLKFYEIVRLHRPVSGLIKLLNVADPYGSILNDCLLYRNCQAAALIKDYLPNELVEVTIEAAIRQDDAEMFVALYYQHHPFYLRYACRYQSRRIVSLLINKLKYHWKFRHDDFSVEINFLLENKADEILANLKPLIPPELKDQQINQLHQQLSRAGFR